MSFYNYFNKKQTYKFDVCDTLGRTSSMLLKKGVTIELGENAATDGHSKIFLPQTMKKYLAWDEIDFVRYLLHHEMSHIKWSQPKEEVLNHIRGFKDDWAYKSTHSQIMAFIVNILEDLRIEQMAIEESGRAGSFNIFHRGRQITKKMWLENLDELADKRPDGKHVKVFPLHTVLCHILFAGVLSPELNKDAAIFKYGCSYMTDLYARFVLTGILEEVHEIVNDVKSFKDTKSLAALAVKIYEQVEAAAPKDESASDQSATEKMRGEEGPENSSPDQFTKEDSELLDKLLDGVSPNGRSVLERPKLQDELRDLNFKEGYNGGMAEQIIRKLCNANGEDEETISLEAIRGGSGRSLGFGEKIPDHLYNSAKSEKHYQWGLWSSGKATDLIDKLRGESRGGYSKPRESGLRVASKNTPAFLSGLTNDILRRKVRQKNIGTAVVFCVDDSGSMSYSDCTVAWSAAAMLSIACERAKIPSMIIRYSCETKVEKLFTQSTASVRHKFCDMWGGGTEARKAIKCAMSHFETRNEQRKALFFLTDGMTDDCRGLVRQFKGSGGEFYPILLGGEAAKQSISTPDRKGIWDMPETITYLHDQKNGALGPMLVEKLSSKVTQ